VKDGCGGSKSPDVGGRDRERALMAGSLQLFGVVYCMLLSRREIFFASGFHLAFAFLSMV